MILRKYNLVFIQITCKFIAGNAQCFSIMQLLYCAFYFSLSDSYRVINIRAHFVVGKLS